VIYLLVAVFRAVSACLNHLPRNRQSLYAMAKRTNHDLVFDHSAAEIDLKFFPRQLQAAQLFSEKR
jgi:hypothetical protein